MNVWMLNAAFFPVRGGIENYFYSAGQVLRDLGHRPLVICRRHHPSLPEREELEGIQVFRHPDFRVPRSRLFRKPSYLTGKIAQWINDSGRARDGLVLSRHLYYQAAVSSLPKSPAQIYMPASCWPRLMSVMSSSWPFQERLWARIWRSQIRRIGKKALFDARRIMVLSRNLKEQLESLYELPPANIEINPPGVDCERFAPGERNPELARRFDLRPETVTLLHIGRLSPEKNLSFLIRAVTPLFESRKVKLLIAGDGPEKNKLEEEIKRGGLQNNIILPGDTDRPEDLYRLSDIFVSSARYESFGQTILEAMASALPVVALKRSPPEILTAGEEIIREGKSGFCVPAEIEAFRDKFKLLIDNADIRREMGMTGRAICLDGYTWKRHIEKLLNRAKTG